VAVLASHHDPPPGTRLADLDLVIGDHHRDPPAFEPAGAMLEAGRGQVGSAALVGDEVDPLRTQPLEELAVVASPVEDDRELALPDHLAHRRHHLVIPAAEAAEPDGYSGQTVDGVRHHQHNLGLARPLQFVVAGGRRSRRHQPGPTGWCRPR
jgi:hypothetical protein